MVCTEPPSLEIGVCVSRDAVGTRAYAWGSGARGSKDCLPSSCVAERERRNRTSRTRGAAFASFVCSRADVYGRGSHTTRKNCISCTQTPKIFCWPNYQSYHPEYYLAIIHTLLESSSCECGGYTTRESFQYEVLVGPPQNIYIYGYKVSIKTFSLILKNALLDTTR